MSGGGRTYAWNYNEQPTSITSGGVQETYAYDAEGTRVKRTRSGATTSYAAGLIEVDPSDEVERRHYLFGGRVIALRELYPFFYGDKLTYLHSDHLGSVAYATSNTGAQVSRQDYTPWGARRGTAEVHETTLDFTGQKKDDTGLLFYNAPLCVISTGWQRRVSNYGEFPALGTRNERFFMFRPIM